MKLRSIPFDTTDLLILLLAVGGLLLAGAVLTVRDVERFLAGAESPQPSDAVPTERCEPVDLERTQPSGWRVLLSTRDARDVALHGGLIYVATDGGLLVHYPSGELIAHYTHLNGLPSNRLSCLASWRGALYIGSDRGLVALRDGVATTFRPRLPSAAVTALLPQGERLLVGTDGAGLLSFDGGDFRADVGHLPGADFRRVTALADWRGQLAVGSRGSGLYVQRGAAFVRLGAGEGLPDERVTALAPGHELLVATVTGLCLVDDRLGITPWARPLTAAAALRTAGATLIGTLDGRLERYSAGRRRDALALGNRRFPVSVNRLAVADGRTWVLASSGPHLLTASGLEPFGERPPVELSANHISALALDAGGNLWVGYFDAGLDIYSPELQQLQRLDDDQCRTIKCLYFDPAEGAVYLGGSKGLVRFGPDGVRSAWTTEEGLISNEVNHVRRAGTEVVAATGGGISFISGSGVRSIYAFHGLINNRVFCLLPRGWAGEDEFDLVVGTLGGISLVAGHQVVGRITPENSELPTHWVTALHELDGSLLVGTYGGGLALRRPDGGWEEMPQQLRGIEVNPNAVLRSADMLLVGTLDRGLIILRRQRGRWEVSDRGLGSPNVTALAADERRIFIGTDNGVVVVRRSNL